MTRRDREVEYPRGEELAAEAFRTLVERVPLGVAVAQWERPPDAGSLRFVWANEAAFDGLGVPPEAWLGRTLREAFPALMTSSLPALYAEALTSQRALRLPPSEVRGVADPSVFKITATPLGPRLLAILYEDVSQQVRAEQRRETTLAELTRSNQELEEFAYVASHDLKAPLQDVESLAGWIIEDAGGELPAGARKHLDRLLSRVRRMKRLLADLLDYCRAGRLLEVSESVSLDAAIREALELANIPGRLEVRWTPQPLPLRTPPSALQRVLLNLLNNAGKHHGKPSGIIEITHEQVAPGWLRVHVRDDGVGIHPRFVERIFGMFQTLRPRDEVEGSGMGLAIARKLVRHAGGDLRVDSRVGHGSCFSFTWPLAWHPAPTDSVGS